MTNFEKQFLLLFAMLFVALTGYSQSKKLFDEIPIEQLQFTEVENDRLQKITSKQIYSETIIADFGQLSEIQENGIIRIDLPNSACESLKYKAENVEYDTNDDFYWYGSLVSEDSCVCADGTLTLMAKEGRTFGYFSVDDEAYDIQALSTTKNTISKIDNQKASGGECGVTSEMERAAKEVTGGNSVKNRGNNNHCNVGVLVLFTNAANNIEPNMNDRIDLAMARANQALRNSGIATCQLKLFLAGEPVQIPIDFTENSDDVSEDLEIITTSDEISNLREERNADIVVLMTNGDYSDGNLFGIVDAIGPNDESAFAIVETDAPDSRFTFAHEVAHLFGAGHDNDPREGIPHGHKIKKCKRAYRTILHRTSDLPRIQHYSNPKVKFKKRKTGKKKKKNNAKQMINTACTVANFRTSELFSAFLWSENDYNDEDQEVNSVCPCGVTQLKAKVYGLPNGAPIQYEWRISTDGVNFGNIVGTSQSFGLNTYDVCESDGYWCFDVCLNISVFVQLRVISENGIQTVTRHFVTDDTWTGQNPMTQSCSNDSPMIGTNTTNAKLALNELSVFPNPSTGIVDITINVTEKNVVVADIFDVTLKHSKKLFNKSVDKGIIAFDFDGSSMQPGVYFIKAKVGTESIVRKLVILK